MKLIPFVGREPHPSTAARQEPAAAPAPPPALPWMDIHDVRRSGADAAMAGLAVDVVHQTFDQLFAQATSLYEERFEPEAALHLAEAQRFEADAARHASIRDTLLARRDELAALIQRQLCLESDHRAAAEGLLRLIRARHLEIQIECARRRDEWDRERRASDLRHRQSLAAARAETAVQDRRENSAVLEAAAEDRRTQLGRLDARLEELGSRSHALQRRGLTPLVARCLIASGMLAFAGIGAASVRLLNSASISLTTVATLPWAPEAAIATGLLPLLAAAALGAGIYVEGLLMRERALARQRARLRDEVERFSFRPTSESYFDSVPHLLEATAPAATSAATTGEGASDSACDLVGVPPETVAALNAAYAAHAGATALRTGAQHERADIDARLVETERAIAAAREQGARATAARVETLARRTEAMLQLAAGYRRATLELDKTYYMTAFAKKAR